MFRTLQNIQNISRHNIKLLLVLIFNYTLASTKLRHLKSSYVTPSFWDIDLFSSYILFCRKYFTSSHL